MIFYLWLIITVFVQFGTTFMKPERHCKGRIITRPMMKVKFFAPGVWLRFKQIIFGWVMQAMFFSWWMSKSYVVYFTWVMMLYLDDYMTGGDDNFKRKFEGVKNKVKWKMDLPLEPAHDKVAS